MGTFEKLLDKLGFEVVEEETGAEEERESLEQEVPVAKGTKKTKEERKHEIVRTTPTGSGDVYVVMPTKRSDAKIVCDELSEGKTVVVYVETMDVAETTRLYDFIQGSVYALGGKIQQVSENVILVAPKGTDIQTNESISKNDDDYNYVEYDELDYGY